MNQVRPAFLAEGNFGLSKIFVAQKNKTPRPNFANRRPFFALLPVKSISVLIFFKKNYFKNMIILFIYVILKNTKQAT